MTVNEAIKILEHHNKWRRLGHGESSNPVKLGIALEIAIKCMKSLPVETPKEIIEDFTK